MKPTWSLVACLFILPGIDSADADELTENSPERLRTLVESYERERTRVLAPVERKFDGALLDLQRYFAKAGRLEDAMAVKAIIEGRNEVPDSPPRWGNTRWQWGSGGELELKRGGEAMHTEWSRPGEWEELDDGSLRLVSQHGEMKIEFADEKSATVTTDRGGRTALTLIE